MISSSNIKAILAGAADHRQYPDPEEDARIEEEGGEEFKNYRKMARTDGYSLENPSTFFIQHVYPTTLGKIAKIVSGANLAEKMMQAFLPDRSITKWPQRAVTKIMDYIGEEK